MPTRSYAYAVGNVRAKEVALLKKQDIEQLLSLDSVYKAASFLKDKGYGYADTPLDIYKLLKDEEQKLWEYVMSVAPDISVFEAFIIANDYHNIKAIFKATVANADYKELLLSPTVVEVETIQKAASEQDFGQLPMFMREAAKKAWDVLVKTGDSQLCDAILDASCMEYRLKFAERIKVPMLAELIETNVFYDNIKAAIRCARAQKSKDFCDICIVDTKALSKSRLKQAALKGVSEVLAVLENVSVYKGAQAAEAFKASPSEFEKFADNILMSVVLRAKYIAVGAEPLIAYLQAKIAEIKACRIAINGISIEESHDKTREMLRELYG